MRHAYAVRADEDYGFSPRNSAGVMGYSLQLHSRHFGSQIVQKIPEMALEQAQAVVARRKLEARAKGLS